MRLAIRPRGERLRRPPSVSDRLRSRRDGESERLIARGKPEGSWSVEAAGAPPGASRADASYFLRLSLRGLPALKAGARVAGRSRVSPV